MRFLLLLTLLTAAMAADVTAPKLLYKMPVEITERARDARLSGTVRLRITIDDRGVPREVRFLELLSDGRPMADALGMDRAAEKAVALWRFTPLLINETPKQVRATVELTF